jgi:aspartyl-tRNA(Asn)/glutamyl-tRNA(Gln) amidotransferase subunit C
MSQPKITVAEVERIAHLARLSPSAAQAEGLARDLNAILAYVEQLSQVDTTDVPVTAEVAPQLGLFREDRVVPGLTREDALAAAPRSQDGGFAVPKVLEVES